MTTQTKPAFTPGPWKVEPFSSQEAPWLSGKVYAADGRVVSYLRPEHGDAPDARLIAAAPDLHWACELACTAMTLAYAADGDASLGYERVEREFGGAMANAYKTMRAALSAATGESK